MGKADFLRLGDWNTVCYQCGFKRKASDMERNWQGYWVCPEHNEPRQPQDFARGVPENPTPPWVQPAPAVIYTYVQQTIGIGDGATTQFQLGDGLYATTVTAVFLNGGLIGPSFYTTNGFGLISLTSVVPLRGDIVAASGSEVMA